MTSPTPYDPPLTYGGWQQSKALGARIASILRSRETDDDSFATSSTKDGHENGDKRRRRHKVVLHTSPFLRCVQTSIGISAGLAQNPGHHHHSTRSSSVPHAKHVATGMHSSPKIRPLAGSPRLAPVSEGLHLNTDSPDSIKKATLRVDAFLGEWLSPDYFENITPPPSSTMMVASAKGDLLRREDHGKLINVRDLTPTVASPVVGFPGGWGSPVVAPKADKPEDADNGPLSSLSSLSNALPVTRRDRTSSLSSAGSSRSGKTVRVSTTGQVEHGRYQSPVPSYAISNSDPIPAGYVAHARDSCTDVDFQWDSSRELQNWGDGGEYGEEWSSMHKRFRKGLSNMVNWYREHDDGSKQSLKFGPDYASAEDDEETDLVVILVSHGAGCNALIGALTNQPVLMDVNMASLTMAVRKPTPVPTPSASPTATPRGHSRNPSRNLNVSDEYDVKLLANTEHLRSPSSTNSLSRQTSVKLPAFKEHYTPTGRNETGGITIGDQTRGMSTVFGSMRRTASVATGAGDYRPVRNNSLGLWTPPKPAGDEKSEDEDEMFPNFGGNEDSAVVESPSNTILASPLSQIQNIPPKEHETPVVATEPPTPAVEKEEDTVAPLGLWGNPRPPGEAERNREMAPKRRWTVNERGMA